MGEKPILQTVYELPISAKLVVETEHGERWDATTTDLGRFGFVRTMDAELAVGLALEQLGLRPHGTGDTDDEADRHSALRYTIERAVRGDKLDRDDPEDREVLERAKELFAGGEAPAT